MKHYDEYNDTDSSRGLVVGVIIVIVALAVFFLSRYLLPPAFATQTPPTCGTETYEFSNEGSNSRVSVNVHDSDEQVDVTGLNGWSVTDLWLDQEGGGTSYVHYSGGNRLNFNPSSFGDIDKVKVTVTKPCPTPTLTPSPTATPSPTIIPTPTPTPSCEQLENCEPEVTPTPRVTPVPEVPHPQPQLGLTTAPPPDAPVCSNETPGLVANIFVAVGTPNDNKLEVRWTPVEPKGPKAHILYGEYGRAFEHALLNTDNDGSEVIGGLKNGVNYRFKVAQVNVCSVGPWSSEFDPKP